PTACLLCAARAHLAPAPPPLHALFRSLQAEVHQVLQGEGEGARRYPGLAERAQAEPDHADPAEGEAEDERPAQRKTQLGEGLQQDRKSTRLNSSHVKISYAVFCLKTKK